MANGYIVLPTDVSNTGKNTQTFRNTISAVSVDATAVCLVTSAGVAMDAAAGNAIAVGGSVSSGAADSGSPAKVGWKYNATLPSLTDGYRVDAQSDVNGRLVVTAGDKSTVAQSLVMTSTANTVALAIQGASTAVVSTTGGSWTGTMIFEAQNDGTNWFTVAGAYPVAGGAPVTTATANGQWLIPCAGFANLRVRCSVVGTNTATVTIIAGIGSDAHFVIAQGNVASAATDSGNPIKVGGKYNTTLPTLTNGQRGDAQSDINGRLIVSAGDKTYLSQSLDMTSGSATVALACQGHSTAIIDIQGTTWTGTVTFDATVDGTNWFTVFGTPPGIASALVSTATARGRWIFCTAGYQGIRAAVSVTGTNSATVSIAAGLGAPGVVVASVAGVFAAGTVTTSGYPVKVGGKYNRYANLPSYSDQAVGEMQLDVNGTLKVGSLPLGTPLTAGANVAASANNQTLASLSNRLAYLSGFAVSGLGATAAGSITVTTTGLGTNLNFVLPIPAGVTAAVTPLVMNFNPPIPASATATDIVVNVASFGTGNTTASASAWGFLV